jgi:hypothetical protein
MRHRTKIGCAAAAAILAAALAGCANRPAEPRAADRQPTAAARAEALAAEQAYRNCLLSAARYADDRALAAAALATLIAPMCYPQFAQLEWAATQGLSSRARRQFEQGGDQRQIDFAGDAIARERAAGSLAASR